VLAVMLAEFGPPSVLTPVELPDLVPGPGQVVVATAFAGITFVETQVRAGRPPKPAMSPDLPVVLGNGVGGTVVAVGDDVDGGLIGTRVVTGTGGAGGYAQQVAVSAESLTVIPDPLPIDDAVALLADGRTALALAELAQFGPGETVVVEAAAGGVGSLLVQLAKNAGARVVALAGGKRKLNLARGFGADFAVDYGIPGWPDTVRDAVGKVDVVLDGVGGATGRAAFELLAARGRYVSFGAASGHFAVIPEDVRSDVARLTIKPIDPRRNSQLVRRALDEAVHGALHPVIGQRYALAQAAAAHAAIEARATLGKTLLVTDISPGGTQ
jgi:NADPH:quinone reductase